MRCKVNKCCFCWSLRWGIILLAYINGIFTLGAVACLVVTTELHRSTLIGDSSLETVTTTILFAILVMNVILNVLLLFAGYQKDVLMLKLYIYYAVATTLAGVVPTSILLSRWLLLEVSAAVFAMAMQCYVIVLVRSEILKLEKKRNRSNEETTPTAEETIVVVPDTTSLL